MYVRFANKRYSQAAKENLDGTLYKTSRLISAIYLVRNVASQIFRFFSCSESHVNGGICSFQDDFKYMQMFGR